MSRNIKIMSMTLFGLLMVCAGLACAAQKEEGANFYSVNSTESLIQVYEDPDRAAWQKPERVVEQLSLKPGQVVADIGAGTGYFSVILAKKVGHNGTVYGVDVDVNMVEYLEKRARKNGLKNIKPILAKTDDPFLSKASTDLIFMCNTYMFIEQRELYLARLKDILKKDGRLVIVSYNKVETPEGPPIHTRVSREKTIQEAQKAGFILQNEFLFLPYQHFLVFNKKQLSREDMDTPAGGTP